MSSPGLRVGPYELLHKIASGGMGEVFIARRTGAQEFEKRVALKLLLPHLADDAELTQRFFDEARLAARMNHPNVVQLFDLGDDHGRPWVAMALVEGVSLALALHRAAKQRALVPLPLVRLIACGLLDGLGYAHALTDAAGTSLGVVHRDVSATNVLVTAAGAVLLTDFGIARDAQPLAHRAGARARQAGLHGPGAAHRPAGRRARRPLLGRGHAVRADLPEEPLSARDARPDPRRGAARAAARPTRAQTRRERALRRRAAQVALEVTRAAPPDRGPAARRAARRPPRRRARAGRLGAAARLRRAAALRLEATRRNPRERHRDVEPTAARSDD
ncbi:MAG: serine/threonine protein kinase [Archangiaceae bacterium]|nr:serine/threonine protein kinase [Archangiaceae bacterium]